MNRIYILGSQILAGIYYFKNLKRFILSDEGISLGISLFWKILNMAHLQQKLELERCPHCSIDKPNLDRQWGPAPTKSYSGQNERFWSAYRCSTCGGVVLATAPNDNGIITDAYPDTKAVDKNIPFPAREYLQQAIDSLHAPAGSVMLSASAVDAMLKKKDYDKGTLYERINTAAGNHLITKDMAKWAHNVKLDANEPRHADKVKPLPTQEDAQRCIAFALALGEILFVLPARVQRGLEETAEESRED